MTELRGIYSSIIYKNCQMRSKIYDFMGRALKDSLHEYGMFKKRYAVFFYFSRNNLKFCVFYAIIDALHKTE